MTISHEIGPFAIVPLWVMDALIEARCPEAIRLYVQLHRWSAGGDRTCHPARQTIADACGVSTDTVDRYVRTLIKVGALRVETRHDDRGQTSNRYTLVITPGGRTDAAPCTEAAGVGRTEAAPPSRVHAAQTIPTTEPDSYASVPPGATHQSKPTRATAAETAAPGRPRNELYDAVTEACGMIQSEMTRTLQGQCGKAVAEMAAAGATPEEVPRRATVYRMTYPNNTLTPAALAKHWAMLREPPRPPVSRNAAMDAIAAYVAEGQPNVVPIRAVI